MRFDLSDPDVTPLVHIWLKATFTLKTDRDRKSKKKDKEEAGTAKFNI